MDDNNTSLYLQAAWNRGNLGLNDAQRIYGSRGVLSSPVYDNGAAARRRLEEEKKRIVEETKQKLEQEIRTQLRMEMQGNEREQKKRFDEMENERRLLMKLLQQKTKVEEKVVPKIETQTSEKLNSNEVSNINDELCCVVCMDLKRNMLCKPCNHVALCENCSTTVKKCPVCNTVVTKIKKIFIS